MFIKYFNIILFIIFFYQTPLYSKSKTLNDFNSQYLSNYFSGIVASENKSNTEALKFYKLSKFLIDKHNPYLERYVYSLVLEGRVQEAVNEIKRSSTKNNSDFFEAHLILALDSLKKKDFEGSKIYLEKSSKFIINDRFAQIIHGSIKEYIHVFKEKKIAKANKNFGNLSFINEVFQRCYLNDENTSIYFRQLINNNSDVDYSRYVFFHINYLIENNQSVELKEVISGMDKLNNTLLISQTKKWLNENKLNRFNKIFSCKNSNDIISEFFFLIANLFSSQGNYEKSNFYLNIANYLNPKFRFNLSLMVENYYLNNNFKKAQKVLRNFNQKDDFYYWFKIKKQTQMISKEFNNKKSLNFINKKFIKIKDPSIKMLLDVANINKNSEKYQKAITYYNDIINKLDPASSIYGEVLYRRGSSYERLGNYTKSDEDLLKSLKINPEDPYVLNYLAYSWLERDYKIDTAISMLEKAYAEKNDDPYIIDSIGWAYYLIEDFLKAEIFLKRAVELMPNDPVVNDHYGDILWKLDRKIQARYFWESVLDLKETEDEMKKDINIKLIEGLNNS
jgi:tetratricopeptide (TPR) repeat protein